MKGRLKTMRSARRLGWMLWLGSAVAFAVGMLLPGDVVGDVRTHWPLLAQLWDGLNAIFPSLNPLHVLWYAWLAMLWWWLSAHAFRWPGVMAIIVLSGVGECLQMLVPGRNARVADVLNDVIGIVLGIGLAVMLRRVLVRKNRSTPALDGHAFGDSP